MLREYDLAVKYVGAKNVRLADTLSRLIVPEQDPEIKDLDVSIASIMKIRPRRLAKLQEESRKDPVLVLLSKYIRKGWPDCKQDIEEILHPYWAFRGELALLDGLIVRGNRVVIPTSLRPEMLDRLHLGHQGITGTLQRARRAVYWPKIQDEITEMVQGCEPCQIHGNKKTRAPMRQISAKRPMEVLSTDIMDFKRQPALVTIDCYSGYILLDPMRSQTASVVVARLNDNIRKFGLAEKILSDNGPCFKADKFSEYCEIMEIEHISTSPHYHEGNGRVERAIQTIRSILNKCETDYEITKAILAYHDTPIDASLPSPGELFFKQRIDTGLGIVQPETGLTDQQQTRLAEKRAAHLKPTGTVKQYIQGQQIWYTEDGTSEWRPGYIDEKDDHPDSYWVINDLNNRRLRRNRHDIKPRIPPRRREERENTSNAEEIVPQIPDHVARQEEPTKVPNKPTMLPRSPKKTPPTVAPPPSTPVLRRSTRQPKPNVKPDFVYNK